MGLFEERILRKKKCNARKYTKRFFAILRRAKASVLL